MILSGASTSSGLGVSGPSPPSGRSGAAGDDARVRFPHASVSIRRLSAPRQTAILDRNHDSIAKIHNLDRQQRRDTHLVVVGMPCVFFYGPGGGVVDAGGGGPTR